MHLNSHLRTGLIAIVISFILGFLIRGTLGMLLIGIAVMLIFAWFILLFSVHKSYNYETVSITIDGKKYDRS